MKKNFLLFFVIMIVSLFIASAWDKFPIIKNGVTAILDPSLGALFRINIYIGFIAIVGIISLLLTLAQKYLSDQVKLKELKEEQKYLQNEMKKYKDNPAKLMEFQKQQLEFIPKTFDLTLKPLIYPTVPIILLYRWFEGHLLPVFGKWWILYYIIASIFFSSIFRKVFKVA